MSDGDVFQNIPSRRKLTSVDLERMKIPSRYWYVKFEHVSNEDQLSIGMTFQAMVYKYLSNMVEMRRNGAGLILWGSNGTGKTSASVVIAKEFRRRGHRVLFMEAADLKRMVVEREYFDDDETFWDRARTVDVLVLDDFGKGIMDAKGFGSSLFDELLRSRSARKLVTIITSNIPPQTWRKELELKESTMQTLKECAVPIEVVGRNMREPAAARLLEVFSN